MYISTVASAPASDMNLWSHPLIDYRLLSNHRQTSLRLEMLEVALSAIDDRFVLWIHAHIHTHTDMQAMIKSAERHGRAQLVFFDPDSPT